LNVTFKPRRITGLLLLALALLTIWLLIEDDDTSTQLSPSYGTRSSDYSMDDFTLTTMNEMGIPSQTLSGKTMSHYPDNDSTEIEFPIAHFFHPQKNTWLITANHGITFNDGDDILLTGNVIITQQENTDVELRTEKLNLDTSKETANTDQPVIIKTASSITHAVGMDAALAEGLVNLHTHVRGRYDPNEH